MWSVPFTDKHGVEKYRFYEKYKDPLTDKWKRVSVVMNKDTKPSQKEAQKRLEDKINEKLNDRTPSSLKTLTFYQAYHEWWEHYSTNTDNKPSSVLTYRSKSKVLLKLFDKDILISKISLTYAQNKMDELTKLGHSSQYNRDVLMVFKHVMNFVRLHYGLDTNFLQDLKVGKKTKTIEDIKAKRENYLEVEEVAEIIKEIRLFGARKQSKHNRRFYDYVAYAVEFMALNGMRVGELLAIQTHNIDLDNKTLVVAGTIHWRRDSSGKFGHKDTTKNESSYRTIGLTTRSCDILRKLMLENKKSAKWEDNYYDRGFVFTNHTGNPIYFQRINTTLKESAENCGIDKHITTHTLRHTHISLLSQQGTSLKAIMERVGHSDHRTTLQIYSHVTEKMDKEMMDKLEAVKIC